MCRDASETFVSGGVYQLDSGRRRGFAPAIGSETGVRGGDSDGSGPKLSAGGGNPRLQHKYLETRMRSARSEPRKATLSRPLFVRQWAKGTLRGRNRSLDHLRRALRQRAALVVTPYPRSVCIANPILSIIIILCRCRRASARAFSGVARRPLLVDHRSSIIDSSIIAR